MLKMLMDPMGGIVMTNDGNAILREVSQDILITVNQVSNIFNMHLLSGDKKALLHFKEFEVKK